MVDPPVILAEYRQSALAFAIFGLLHSVGAREGCKDALARVTGDFFVRHFWRLVYCALSYYALYHVVSVLHWSMNREYDRWLFVYPEWAWQVVMALHLGTIGFFYAALLQSDYLEFWGVKQAWRGVRRLAGRPVHEPLRLFGTDRLVTHGVYGVVRHPMMAGGFWFLLTSGPSLNNVVFTAFYATYMVVGGYFEERRMLRLFGDEYRAYRRRVPPFLPHPWKLLRG